MRRILTTLTATALLGAAIPAAADIFPRAATPAGSVIARKSGEEVSFIDLPSWRGVDVHQDLLPGDTLRTNAEGHLALLFADNTQIRMARNTTLVVKQVGAAEDTVLGLEAGAIWARAERGGEGLTVETPAAAAAIRGTDWTLKVGGNGDTTLAVFEGTVELSNAQGSVTVHQGEGALALIGKAPTKYVLVDLKEREQVLLYGELRNAFTDLPATGGPAPRARAERSRILAIPEGTRSAGDWLSLAEVALAVDGRAAAAEALSHLRRPLPRPLEARALLVEAMLAGQERRYGEAAALFGKAQGGLSADRKATAVYGGWFAQSLADPDHPHKPPPAGAYAGDVTAALARATAVNFAEGPAAAIEVLLAAERRFPSDARLPAMRADLAYQLDRREMVDEALKRALALDPDEPSALLVQARYRATVFSDLDGALAILRHAADVAPGADAVWNEIGIVQSDRNAVIEADAAHRKAIALNPENPALYANYARFLIDNDQTAAARKAIDEAEALDPESYAVLAAKGRYLLRMGKRDEAEQALLAASAVNPTYGDGLIGLAIAAYQQGAREEAEQALDNAGRFDPEDPSVPLIRSAIAIDDYRADDAITQAREALEKRQARGGYYSGFDSNRQMSSYLGVALGFVGLDEWQQYYFDRGFDPFKGSTYTEESTNGPASPFVGGLFEPDQRNPAGSTSLASQFQGELQEPLSIANSNKRSLLETTTFLEAEGAGAVVTQDDSTGWESNLSVQGTGFIPLPFSFNVQGALLRPQYPRDNDDLDIAGGSVDIGFHPTLADRMVLFGNRTRVDTDYPGQTFAPTPFDRSSVTNAALGGGWSHTFGERNVVQAFIVGNANDTDLQIDLEDAIGPYRVNDNASQDTLTGGLGQMIGVGPLTARFGAEASRYDLDQTVVFTDLITNLVFQTDQVSSEGRAVRAYADATLDVTSRLKVEAGVFPTWFDDDTINDRINPRVGAAFAPFDGQWLRAFYREDTQLPSDYTLAPLSTVGLQPLDLPIVIGGVTRTTGAQWDAEWSDRFFTSLGYQHQQFDGLSLDIPKLVGASFDVTSGTIDRFSASGNVWIGGGLAAFGTFVWNESEDRTPFFGTGGDVPLIPQYQAHVGFTYVSPWRFKVTVAQSFVGERVGNPVDYELEPYTTTDMALNWKSDAGNLELDLKLLNLFDNDFELVNYVPGPGRSIIGRLKARF